MPSPHTAADAFGNGYVAIHDLRRILTHIMMREVRAC